MDYGVVLAAMVLGLAALCAGLVVVLRRRLPADVLAEVEALPDDLSVATWPIKPGIDRPAEG